jgi:CRISPR type IV-associated protein Csf3
MSTHGRKHRGFEPLRVIATMAEPIVYGGDGMCLDGIIAAAWFRDLPYGLTSRWPSATRDEPWVRDLELPLAQWSIAYDGPCDPRLRDDQGRVWGWSASAVHAEWVHARHEVRKRVAVDEMARWSGAGDVDVSSGRFKAHDLRLGARLARHLEWYCLGVRSEIERVLTAHITALGRKVGQGMGRVLGWQVTPWHADWSVMREGRVTRPMPQGFARGRVEPRGIRPLYWHHSRVIACVVPDERDMVPHAD